MSIQFPQILHYFITALLVNSLLGHFFLIFRMKRERQMFLTSMELWEAERRYQATVVEKARGYEGPGLTSLAEEQVSLMRYFMIIMT